jgi:hypothetical protein
VGDRVRLLPPHRHAGQVGVYVGYASWQRMWGARVRLEDGTEVPVWRNVEWERVDEESRGSPQGT